MKPQKHASGHIGENLAKNSETGVAKRRSSRHLADRKVRNRGYRTLNGKRSHALCWRPESLRLRLRRSGQPRRPIGQIAIIPILIGGWALVELGLSAADIANLFKTALDPCSTALDLTLAAGFVGIGFVSPGGGYAQSDESTFFVSDALMSRAWIGL
jgi:hypothetical protein